MIDRRTDKIGTKHFLENAIIQHSPVPIHESSVILDNHSANHSYLVTGFCRDQLLELMFLPPYSSVLNPGKPFHLFSITTMIWYTHHNLIHKSIVFSWKSVGCFKETLGQKDGLLHPRCFFSWSRSSPWRSMWTNFTVSFRGSNLLSRWLEPSLH